MSARFASHRQLLREALDEARQLADAARAWLGARADCLDVAVSKIRALGCGDERPGLLVVGQTKAGKSTFINQLLGEHMVAQSQCPCTSQVIRLTHSTEAFVNRAASEHDATAEVLLGLTSAEFLSEGFDLIDTPGLNENSQLDEVTMAAVGRYLPLVLYVIDANFGVNQMVETDIRRIGAQVGGLDQIFYLVTKADADPTDTQESGRSPDDAEREKFERVLASLRRLGCLGQGAAAAPTDGDRLVSVSCRRVAAARRRQRRRLLQSSGGPAAAGPTPDETRWLEGFQRAKLAILAFAERRLTDLVVEAACCLRRTVLLELHAGLGDAAGSAETVGHRRRLRLAGIEHSVSRLRAESQAAAASGLERRISALLSQSRDDAKAAARAATCIAGSQGVAEVCARVSELLLPRIQLCTQALVVEFFRSCVALMKVMEDFGKESPLPEPPLDALSLLRAAILEGFALPEHCLQVSPQQQQLLLQSASAVKQKPPHYTEWKDIVARNFLRSISAPKLAERIESEFQSWHEKRRNLFLGALQSLEEALRLESLVSAESMAAAGSLQSECLRLSFQIATVLTECEFDAYTPDSGMPMATGTRGSKVRRLSDVSGLAQIAVKEFIVTDSELKRIAAALHYSSSQDSNSGCLVKIKGTRLCRLGTPSPIEKCSWQLQLYMDYLPCSLQLFLQESREAPLSEKLRIGLATAEALAQLHSQRVAHLNLHPANVFISCKAAALVVKLSDLGQHASALTAVSPSTKLFSELVAEDIRCLGRILEFLVCCQGTGEPGISHADAPGEELNNLLRECRQSQQQDPAQHHGCLSAAEVSGRLKEIILALPQLTTKCNTDNCSN